LIDRARLAATHPVQLKAAGAKSPAKNAASRDLLRRSKKKKGKKKKEDEEKKPWFSFATPRRFLRTARFYAVSVFALLDSPPSFI
jgi:hypothetical protein